ncbi:MAG: hypothetical protein K8F91_26395 [Candidatus Obscuribacterales bacterium]|nr:hypothetical protein [Candidatus Obscuribacterales bacterium]
MVARSQNIESFEPAAREAVADRLRGESLVGDNSIYDKFALSASASSSKDDSKMLVPELFPLTIVNNSKTRVADSLDFSPPGQVAGKYLEVPPVLASTLLALQPAQPGSANQALLDTAQKSLTKKPIKLAGEPASAYDSVAVSEMLKETGFGFADGKNEGELVKQLISNGWKLVGVKEGRHGDLIFGGKIGTNWRSGSADATIGIISKDGRVYQSDAQTGQLKLVGAGTAFDPASFGDQVWALRPPDSPGATLNRNIIRDLETKTKPKPEPEPESGADNRIAPPGDRLVRPGDSLSNPNGSEGWREFWSKYWQDYWREYFQAQKRNPDRDKSIERGHRIIATARQFEGNRLWQQSQYWDITSNGKRGSAASVSEVLKAAGFAYAEGHNVATLARVLVSRGWQPVPVESIRPGDIVYGAKVDNWQGGGGNAHIAIAGDQQTVYGNDSESGIFNGRKLRDAFDREQYGKRIWALRPPARDVYSVRDDRAADHLRGDRPENRTAGLRQLADLAVNSVGKQLWRFIRGVPARLGCASSVSAVLNAAGFKYARSAGVGGLESQLLNNGWQKLPVSAAQPGDVVIGARTASYRQGGGGSHIGVVGYNGKVYHNSSAAAQWREAKLSYYSGGRFRHGAWVLRPPA